jgi:tetratricopeptide (TPR) repeat protein
LLAGNLRGDVNALPVRALFARSRLQFDPALDECERASLVEILDEGGPVTLRMPQVAKKFAARELPTAEGSLAIERDLSLLKEVYGARTDVDEAEALARQITGQIMRSSDAEQRLELTKVLEALADQHPSSWRIVADLRERLGNPPESIREAYEMAARHEPNNADVWEAWARFEGKQGDERREGELFIRAAESQPENIGLNSHAAYRIAHLISSNLQAFPVADRAVWTAVVKRNLEEQFDRLDAGPVARLGWLYYLENDLRNAERCARRGLEVEPGHEHCTNILKRLGIVK